MDLAIYLQAAVRNFNRYNKYSIGSELRDHSRHIISLIIRANSRREKREALEELVENAEALKSLLVFSKEVKAFENFNTFKHSVVLAVSLCKQSEGWLKSSMKGTLCMDEGFGHEASPV